MTNDECERIKNMTRNELEKMVFSLKEDNERLNRKVSNVSKNSYDITDPDLMERLAKELKQAAKECCKFARYYGNGYGSLPSGEHLQKFIYIY